MDGGGGHRTNRCRTWTPPPKSNQLNNCGRSLQEKKARATRIFSPLSVPRLCVTIGHYWYLFKRLDFGAVFTSHLLSHWPFWRRRSDCLIKVWCAECSLAFSIYWTWSASLRK